jgi:valyl-tRNA synthetase
MQDFTLQLPDQFDAPSVEAELASAWERDRIYAWDATRPREETFVVDTPPPTVSGSLHVGHAFSYTQTDVIVRYQRMRGRNIYYPMGWDDNGLPTERRVQRFFHVRVDPSAPPAELAEPTEEDRTRSPRRVPRSTFIELCHRVTRADEKVFQALFTRLALSVDWRETYATIDDQSRRLAQLSFLDLHAKGHVYSAEAPTLCDIDFQTAIAQAEVEDRMYPGAMHELVFAVEDADPIAIATSRPELLAACVGVAVHPDDPRHRSVIGRTAITPCFAAPVPIFASPLVDRDKGTGIVMTCTFGDQTDVTWWREHALPLRQVLGRDGRMLAIRFGEAPFTSRDPARANACYAQLAGKSVDAARAAMVAELRAFGALRSDPDRIERPVKFFEKGERPLELIPTRQWYVKLLDHKPRLLEQGRCIAWHPPFMAQRYATWTENLQLDWAISRQRYFGVQIPVWYPLDAAGEPLHDRSILASPETLPIDPTVDVPPGYTPEQRGQPNGFAAETDVFDTWFTSSLTPQIASRWRLDPERHARLFPADIRPQSHEIIRTWAFYTIAKAYLHTDTVPWHDVLLSGWVLDPDRKKMAKTRGNTVTPSQYLDRYSADAVRYWAASARLGVDTAFDETVFKVGRRLVLKLFNAARFVLSQTAEEHPIDHPLDRAFLGELRTLVADATADFEAFRYADALARTEQFFWSRFTDAYLELVKGRARGDHGTPAERGSAVQALRLALGVLLRLFAPVLPYVTDYVWQWRFAGDTGHPSIHRAPWPTPAEIAVAPADELFQTAAAAQAAVNKAKAERKASVGRMVTDLALAANATTIALLASALDDLTHAARAPACECIEDSLLADGQVRVSRLAVAPQPAKPPRDG